MLTFSKKLGRSLLLCVCADGVTALLAVLCLDLIQGGLVDLCLCSLVTLKICGFYLLFKLCDLVLESCNLCIDVSNLLVVFGLDLVIFLSAPKKGWRP